MDLTIGNASTADILIYEAWPIGYPNYATGATHPFKFSKNEILFDSVPNSSPPLALKGCIKLIQCQVFINKALITSAGFGDRDIQKTWAHEIGHCLGFDEANDGSRSIMAQGRLYSSDWPEYWKPQSHDKADLRRFDFKQWQGEYRGTMEEEFE